MKRTIIISFLLVCLMAITSCYKETEYDWVDKTDHVFDYWSATQVNIFYMNSDNGALFELTDITKCPVVSEEKLTDAEVDSVRKTLSLEQCTYYTVSGTISGYYVVTKEGTVTAVLYNESGYAWPCLIPCCHINNTGTTTSYIYVIDSEGKASVDTLVGNYHYAKEDDHWLVEATKMTLDNKEVWSKGGSDVGVVIQK